MAFELSAIAVGLIGLGIGVVVGFAVRRAKLCSMGAIESALVAGDWRRMKVFGFALAIAIAGTQALILAGLFDATQSTYVPTRVAWLSASLGSVVFGLGMALVGTCAFGSLVRLGGGDLRSLVTMLIFGVVAYAGLRGVLAAPRLAWLEPVSLEMPGPVPGSFADAATRLLNFDSRIALGLAAVICLILPVVLDRRLRQAPRLLLAGVLLGLGVVGGWLFTSVIADGFATNVRVQSLTFVAPVARALYGALLGTGELLDFGVMSVFGVVLGAFAAALWGKEFRWEAFDDHHEMRQHLLGAALMGLGGVLAGGCTIGQGLTAGSLLAVTSGAWVVYAFTLHFTAFFLILTPVVAGLAVILAAVAIPTCDRADAARTRLGAQGLDLGM